VYVRCVSSIDTLTSVDAYTARPKLSEVVQETKFLLQQSREKLVITWVARNSTYTHGVNENYRWLRRIANDLSAYETDRYKIHVVSRRRDNALRFHLGEQITVEWRVPQHHSRRDWIGLYRVGANRSSLVTRTSSLGMWVPVHDEEWDGNIPIGQESQTNSTANREDGACDECGTVVFKGDSLPWTVGQYEMRYHHDGKYNVLATEGPIEIFGASVTSLLLPVCQLDDNIPVDRPEIIDFESVRAALAHVVTLCLDGDPSLIPSSTAAGARDGNGVDGDDVEDGRDPDDFRFWSARQAWRIARVVREMFGVEYAPDVVVADANLTALAERIVASLKLEAYARG
jgi:phosphatidylethanolamine N-methyltransferase